MDKDDKSIDGNEPKPGEQSQEPEKHGVKDTISALRSAVEGGELARAPAPVLRYAEQLAQAGKSPEQIAQQMRAEGYAQSVVEEAVSALGSQPAGALAELPATVVEMPVTDAEGRPIQLDVGDEETAAAMQTVADRARLGDEYQQVVADIEEQQAGIAHFGDMVANHPDALVAEFLGRDPQRAALLARGLVALPGVREIMESDPREDAEILATMAGAQREAEATAQQRDATRRYARTVHAGVDRLVGKMTGQEADLARVDLLRDIAAAVRQHGGPIAVAELHHVLAARLAQFGIDPAAAAQAFTSTAPPRPRARAAPTAEDAGTVGQRFAAGSAARRAAAAVPGAGAGGRVTKIQPPPHQNVKERLAWLKNLVKPKG